MKIAVCIQAQDTGRILFIKEKDALRSLKWEWTWPATYQHHSWVATGGTDSLRREVRIYVHLSDETLHWYNQRSMNTVLFKIPNESHVYQPPGDFGWYPLFELPTSIHPFIDASMSDLLFLDGLVTPEL